MKKRLSKKAYFFLIDSILALGVLAVGGFLIFTFYLQAPPGSEPSILSEDIMDFFANNKVQDINNPEVSLGGTYWSNAEVIACHGQALTPNPENTLLQQVALLYADSISKSCYRDIARTYIQKLTQGVFPQQYAFEFWMNNVLLYPATEQISAKNAAKILIPSKRIVYGIRNQETGDMLGPYDTEVLVWQ